MTSGPFETQVENIDLLLKIMWSYMLKLESDFGLAKQPLAPPDSHFGNVLDTNQDYE